MTTMSQSSPADRPAAWARAHGWSGLPTTVVTATDLARRGHELRALAGEQPVLVTRRGKPVAVVVSDRDTVMAAYRAEDTVSARALSRSGAAAACLDAAEAGESRVLTETNRPVAVVQPVEVFLRALGEAADEAFANVTPPVDADLVEEAEAAGMPVHREVHHA